MCAFGTNKVISACSLKVKKPILLYTSFYAYSDTRCPIVELAFFVKHKSQ